MSETSRISMIDSVSDGGQEAEQRPSRNGRESPPADAAAGIPVDEPADRIVPARDKAFERSLVNDIRKSRKQTDEWTSEEDRGRDDLLQASAEIRSLEAQAKKLGSTAARRADLKILEAKAADADSRIQMAGRKRLQAKARLNALVAVRERYFVEHDLFKYSRPPGSYLPRRVEPDPEVWG